MEKKYFVFPAEALADIVFYKSEEEAASAAEERAATEYKKFITLGALKEFQPGKPEVFVSEFREEGV